MIEIVVVVAILSVIAGMAVPVVTIQITRGKIDDTRGELRALKPAIEAYFQDLGAFPPTFGDLEQNLGKATGWNGPYMTSLLAGRSGSEISLDKDGWNVAYSVKVVSTSAIEVRSGGPDKKQGTGDDLVQTIDVTPIRRQQTLDELAILNTAVRAYNDQFLGTSPLKSPFSKALATLAAKGFLPSSYTDLTTDGWGDAYVESPKGKSPIVAVASPTLDDGSPAGKK